MRRVEIERLLPGIFQRAVARGSLGYALLESMEALHAPSEAALATLHTKLDPRLAPDPFVPYLARWVDLDRLYDDARATTAPAVLARLQAIIEFDRLRDLVADAAYLSRWRGTAKGLLRFLETATGVRGFAIDESVADRNGVPRPFHMRITAPAAAEKWRALIIRIIELEKPVYVTYELAVQTTTAVHE